MTRAYQAQAADLAEVRAACERAIRRALARLKIHPARDEDFLAIARRALQEPKGKRRPAPELLPAEELFGLGQALALFDACAAREARVAQKRGRAERGPRNGQADRSGENVLFAIAPYRHQGTWVFDDEGRGLDKEPFVHGMDLVLDQLTAGIPRAERGFSLLFSRFEFPGQTTSMVMTRPEGEGYWYYDPRTDLEGWLCPALLRYFSDAPTVLHVGVQPLVRTRGAR